MLHDARRSSILSAQARCESIVRARWTTYIKRCFDLTFTTFLSVPSEPFQPRVWQFVSASSDTFVRGSHVRALLIPLQAQSTSNTTQGAVRINCLWAPGTTPDEPYAKIVQVNIDDLTFLMSVVTFIVTMSVDTLTRTLGSSMLTWPMLA